MTAVVAIASVLSTFFAAIAARAALRSIRQAHAFHDRDVADRQAAREAEANEFDREFTARRSAWEDERRARLLEQLQRVSDLVAVVRQTAGDEVAADDSLTPRPGVPRFFWNARKQLEAAIEVFVALGGSELPQCTKLATGSTMTHLSFVASAATDALSEIAVVATVHAERQRLAVADE
jgi:hypothetical protein